MSEHNARALSVEELVRALKAAGSRTITEETVNADIAAGAPVNEDGTLDLFKYSAWVLKEVNTNGV